MPPRCLPQLLALVTASLLTATPAPAQTSTAVVELSDRPVVRESLGLRLFLPIGAEAQTYELGDRSSLTVLLPNSLGVINIQDSASAPEATLSSICDGIIRSRLSIDPPRQLPKPNQRMGRGALLSRAPNLTIAQAHGPSHLAERLYLAIEDSSSSAAVMGYTVIKPTPTRVLTFELITDPNRYAEARNMYELTVASATIEDPTNIAEKRRLGIETGVRWLQDVNQDRLTTAVQSIGENWNWQRLSKPSLAGGGDDAAEEIGYRRISARIGRRGDLRKDNIRNNGIDNQRGYVVRIESRTLHQSLIIDSSAVFFLSLDKKEEAWSVEMAIRDQKTGQLQRSSEIGIRLDNDVTVSTRLGDQPLQTSKPQIEGPGYISRVESFLLPYLLVQTGLPTEYRFYCFQSQSGRIQMRADSLETRNDQQNGAWTLTTRLSQDDEPQVAILDKAGAMLLTRLSDGARWEPIELAKLGRLWRAKRLPMN